MHFGKQVRRGRTVEIEVQLVFCFVLSIMGVRGGKKKTPENQNDSLPMITKSSPCN